MFSARAKKLSLGELVTLVHQRMLAKYRDHELASVATSAIINDILTARAHAETAPRKAA